MVSMAQMSNVALFNSGDNDVIKTITIDNLLIYLSLLKWKLYEERYRHTLFYCMSLYSAS